MLNLNISDIYLWMLNASDIYLWMPNDAESVNAMLTRSDHRNGRYLRLLESYACP